MSKIYCIEVEELSDLPEWAIGHQLASWEVLVEAMNIYIAGDKAIRAVAGGTYLGAPLATQFGVRASRQVDANAYDDLFPVIVEAKPGRVPVIRPAEEFQVDE